MFMDGLKCTTFQTSQNSNKLSQYAEEGRRGLQRAARVEWQQAKITSGREREVHLFYCKRFALGYVELDRAINNDDIR
jgi:hypothetical protein